ncbi:MAG: DUF1292 domain-containing protein [Firmicutes bacterium]|nr:DUF1292 domain-containing protein [Bacillota bacterium]
MEGHEEIITLVDDAGERFDFLVLDYFEVDDFEYAVLIPYDKNGSFLFEKEDWSGEIDLTEEEGDAIIFRVIKGNNGETVLHMIEDEEEWDKVVEIAYKRLLSESGDTDSFERE